MTPKLGSEHTRGPKSEHRRGRELTQRRFRSTTISERVYDNDDTQSEMYQPIADVEDVKESEERTVTSLEDTEENCRLV